jgi:hypothetical protein
MPKEKNMMLKLRQKQLKQNMLMRWLMLWLKWFIKVRVETAETVVGVVQVVWVVAADMAETLLCISPTMLVLINIYLWLAAKEAQAECMEVVGPEVPVAQEDRETRMAVVDHQGNLAHRPWDGPEVGEVGR